ncbi:hypothetical protein [Pedococcus sp. P5_B7]
MRTRLRASKPASAHGPAGQVAAADACAFALELGGLRAPEHVDVMGLGIVLEAGEHAHRTAWSWVRWRVDGQWSPALWCHVVVTDHRLLVRLPDGTLRSQWWSTLVGFEADLVAGHVILDYGDGRPRLFSGPQAAVLAVAGVAMLYGPEALVSHPALDPIRSTVAP